MTFDRDHAAALVNGPPDDMLWDADSAYRGEGTPSADYVDGWNDAVHAQAAPLAEQLTAAIAHIAALEERPITLKFTRCVWCGHQRDVQAGETHEQALRIATEHAWQCTSNPLLQELTAARAQLAALTNEAASLRVSRNAFREIAEQVHATINSQTAEFEKLTTAIEASVKRQVATAEHRAFLAGAQWSETAPLGARDLAVAAAAYVAAGERTHE